MEEIETPSSNTTIQTALVDLYLNVKIRSTEEINNYSEVKLEEERLSLKDTEPLLLIEYIRSSIEILLNMRSEENALIKLKEDVKSVTSETPSIKEIPKVYEEQIQKLEEEVRSHIRVNLFCSVIHSSSRTQQK